MHSIKFYALRVSTKELWVNRHHVRQRNPIPPYALMVFDCAMLQLGGLAVQSRGNKIANPHDAVRLAELVANWLVSVAPELTA
jgi:hypothetical protein